jgi:predicted porin
VYYGGNAIRTATYKAQSRSFGIIDEIEIGSLSLRGAFMDVRFEAPGNGIGDMLDPFIEATEHLPPEMGAQAAAHARHMNSTFNMSNQQKLKMYDVGFSYDPGAWLLMAEVFHQKSDQFMREDTAGYISSGVRVGSFTPYLTFAKAKHTRDYDQGIPLAGLPQPLAEFGATINGVVLSFANFDTSQQTISAGARWDFASNFALKAQYDHIQLGDDAQGLLANIQPGFKNGGSLNVLSIAVDFMF